MPSFYNRQQEMGLETNISVFIVGLGGVGFNVALQLAMSGVPRFYLADDDILEVHNLNRIPVGTESIGERKVDAARRKIKELRSETSTIGFPGKFNEMMIPSQLDWIVDCTDLLKTQKEIYQIAINRGIKYCKLGYDGDSVSIFSSPAQWGESEEEEQGGYEVTPSWTSPAHLVASLGVAKILKYQSTETSTTVGQILGAQKGGVYI